MIVLVMIYVHIIKINAIMQFVLCLEMLKIMGDELELDTVTLNQENVNLSVLM